MMQSLHFGKIARPLNADRQSLGGGGGDRWNGGAGAEGRKLR